MSIGGLLISALIVAIVAVWVFMPLLRRPDSIAGSSDAASQIAGQRERLVILYERALRNIRDLDEDFELGKLNNDEYNSERQTLVQRGVVALQGLERLDSSEAVIENPETDAALDEQLEDFIRQSTAALMMQRKQKSLSQPTMQE